MTKEISAGGVEETQGWGTKGRQVRASLEKKYFRPENA